MKRRAWTKTRDEQARMVQVQGDARSLSAGDPGMEWLENQLHSTNLKWTRHAIWGARLMDFWCAKAGIAVEIDADPEVAEFDFRRSAIITLIVRPFDKLDMAKTIDVIEAAGTWAERRSLFVPKRSHDRAKITQLPFAADLQGKYIAGLLNGQLVPGGSLF